MFDTCFTNRPYGLMVFVSEKTNPEIRKNRPLRFIHVHPITPIHSSTPLQINMEPQNHQVVKEAWSKPRCLRFDRLLGGSSLLFSPSSRRWREHGARARHGWGSPAAPQLLGHRVHLREASLRKGLGARRHWQVTSTRSPRTSDRSWRCSGKLPGCLMCLVRFGVVWMCSIRGWKGRGKAMNLVNLSSKVGGWLFHPTSPLVCLCEWQASKYFLLQIVAACVGRPI